jgi:hypothetical protein
MYSMCLLKPNGQRTDLKTCTPRVHRPDMQKNDTTNHLNRVPESTAVSDPSAFASSMVDSNSLLATAFKPVCKPGVSAIS